MYIFSHLSVIAPVSLHNLMVSSMCNGVQCYFPGVWSMIISIPLANLYLYCATIAYYVEPNAISGRPRKIDV